MPEATYKISDEWLRGFCSSKEGFCAQYLSLTAFTCNVKVACVSQCCPMVVVQPAFIVIEYVPGEAAGLAERLRAIQRVNMIR